MANNDFETLARALLSGRQGQSAAGVLDKMGALLKTEDGRRLLTLLASGGADTIKAAAQAALRGDEATARAALIMYAARYPERSGASSGSSSRATRLAVGKECFSPQGVSKASPNRPQSFSTMPLMRGMLLHCDMMKEHSASHLS